jgi:hypothetical protein
MHYPANPLSRVRGVPDAATTAAVLSSCPISHQSGCPKGCPDCPGGRVKSARTNQKMGRSPERRPRRPRAASRLRRGPRNLPVRGYRSAHNTYVRVQRDCLILTGS